MVTPLDLYARVEALVDPAPDADRDALDACARFAREVLPPGRGAELEARGELPAAELAALARYGIARELAPREHGGALEWSRLTRVCSRLAAHDLDFTLCLGGAVLGALPVLVCGSAAHRAAYFAPILRGEMGGFGLTEWGHGSDILAGEASATPLDAAGAPTTLDAATSFRLEGAKAPINNGARGACLVLLVRTGDGVDAGAQSLFFVERATPGLEPHARFATTGHRSMDLAGAVLRGAIVGRDALMGSAGDGFTHARRALEISRSGVAAMALGPAASALALAIDHARERRLYGAPIAELGGVRVLLARSFARLVAATALARRASRTVARFAVPGRALSCAAKLVTPALMEETIAECGTLLGARSLMSDLPFSRLRRSAPTLAIFDGSSQLQLDELWRHAAAWRARGSLDEARAREILGALASPPDAFDPHGDDAGEVAASTPPAMLEALAPSAPELPLAALARAAERVSEIAGRARGAPQPHRFRVASAAATLATVAALAEAHAREATPQVAAALDLYAAESAGPLAAALVAIGAADVAPDVLAIAARAPRACDAAYDALLGVA